MTAEPISAAPIKGEPEPYCSPAEHRALLKSMRGQTGIIGDTLHALGVRLGIAYGGSFYYPSEDRSILECVILPYYQLSQAHKSIVFAGSDWYTHGYTRMFARKTYRTIDPDPKHAQYGAAQHIVDVIGNIDRYVEPGSLDLIVINGIVGWGINTLDDANATMAACYRSLRKGGHLLIGWNDIPAYRPFLLDEIPSLGQFQRLEFEPLGRNEYLVANEWRHTYSFFIK